MSYLQHILDCNQYSLSNFRSFYVNGLKVGQLKHDFAEILKTWPKLFTVSSVAVSLNPTLDSFIAKTQAMAEVSQSLVEKGVIPNLRQEAYPVTSSSRKKALFTIDRGVIPHFGIKAFGQHLNGFVRDQGQLKIWVGRRAKNKWSDSNKLDNMVAGGLPHDISLADNLAKECWEEAGIPLELSKQAYPVGYISYQVESAKGLLKPDVIYCYDLELPADFTPQCQDGEVEEFYLWSMDKVADIVCHSDEFKKNCNLVIIDFLIRHGFITPDHPEYFDLVSGLRSPLST
ncbi:DUF4743 domain-containing protein [Candidatus Nitrosacidococcus sp. I8]|uniref:DUF4743 domain-containing protein n=1 Tax=Candidatus Nitrosacidococcus sp. I8 TaxID=2942908 RepID=UPI002227F816|nr:DUF4743 domain-containing protein [Candidatus Nitrosacidococcus sp. I8]CAH9017965.1 hypothetical protein NURINAE_00652 [Candidatus Nitrosacidococcus sp. I8]